MTPIGSGTIRRYGLVELGVALCWRKCITVWMGFEVSYAQATPSGTQFTSCYLWIKMQNTQLLLQHHVFLHASMSHHDDNYSFRLKL